MAWCDVFEGAPLTGSMIGADLGPYPYISGFGLLQRVSRLGELQPSELAQLGFRHRADVDVLVATQRACAPRKKLVAALGLEPTKVPGLWSIEPWSPAGLDGALDRDPGPLRRCIACAEHGYHTAVFQLPSVTHCPWHGEYLVTRCPKCDRTLGACFDAKGRLGRCTCGYDPFRVASAASNMWNFPTEAADAWLTQYLRWAASERERRWVVLPEVRQCRDRALQALAAPPQDLQTEIAPPLGVTTFEGSRGRVPEGAFRGWALFGSDRPLTFVPLAASLHGRLCDATLEVVRQFPTVAGTPIELVYSHDFAADQVLEANVMNRPDCFIAPFSCAGEEMLWLNISAVDPGIPAFCCRLLDQVVSALVPDSQASLATPIKRSPAALQSAQLEALEGATHLTSALEAVLIQGYKQGLDAILRSMAGLEFPSVRAWLAPAVEVVGDPGLIQSVRVCWTAVRPPLMRRTLEVPIDRPAKVSRRRATPPRRSSRKGKACRSR